MARIAVLSLLPAVVAASCTFDVTPDPGSDNRERSSAEFSFAQSTRRTQMVAAGERADAGQDGGRSSTPTEPRDAGRPNATATTTTTTPTAGSKARPEGGAGAAAGSSSTAGSSGAAGSSSSAPDAGTHPICVAGQYAGTFDGSVTFLQGSVSGIKGTIRAELVLDPAGDYLRVRDGHVTGANDLGATMNAGWIGALSCTTGELEGAELTDGAWDNGTRFSGPLTGTYSVSTASLSGTWRVTSTELPWAGGDGEWNMQLAAAP